MDKEVDSFLIEVSDDVFSSLSELLALVMPGEVSGMGVEGFFHSDSFLFFKQGFCLFSKLLHVALLRGKGTRIGG